jgi:hypothetical protein
MSPHSATPASNIDQSAPSNPRNRLSLAARMIMTSPGVGLFRLRFCSAQSRLGFFFDQQFLYYLPLGIIECGFQQILKPLNVEFIDEFEFVHGHASRVIGKSTAVAQTRPESAPNKPQGAVQSLRPLFRIFAKLDPVPKIGLYKIAHWNSPTQAVARRLRDRSGAGPIRADS